MRLAQLALAATLLVSLQASAQMAVPQLISENKDWTSYSQIEDAGNFCFAVTHAIDASPSEASDTNLFISNRPAEGIKNELNIVSSIEFKAEEMLTLSVGNKEYKLFSNGNQAWLFDISDSAELDELIEAMRASSKLSVEGLSSSGAKVTLQFSLSGATASLRSIDGC